MDKEKVTFKTLFSDLVSKEEFTTSVKTLLKVLSDGKKQIDILIKQFRSEADQTFRRFEAAREQMETRTSSLRDGIDGKDYVLSGEDKEEIAAMVNIPVVEKVVETIIRETPIVTEVAHQDNGEDIRNKLEAAFVDAPEEEKMDPRVIRGWDDFEKKVSKTTNSGTNFVIVRGQVMAYYLDDVLDGSTKTFALPAFWRVISVHSSSTPNPMRETTDWTTDGGAMTITFTSAVDEATTLSAGQRILIQYASA